MVRLNGQVATYCFSGLPVAPKGGSATIDHNNADVASTGAHSQVAELEIANTQTTNCNPGENVEVTTAYGPNGILIAEPFYIVLYG
jgi:hypothetical protein